MRRREFFRKIFKYGHGNTARIDGIERGLAMANALPAHSNPMQFDQVAVALYTLCVCPVSDGPKVERWIRDQYKFWAEAPEADALRSPYRLLTLLLMSPDDLARRCVSVGIDRTTGATAVSIEGVKDPWRSSDRTWVDVDPRNYGIKSIAVIDGWVIHELAEAIKEGIEATEIEKN